jgi:hypothetical protein
MPSGSDLQDSVDRTRDAFRRISADEADDRRPWAAPVHDDAPPPAPAPRGDVVGQLHPFFQGLFESLPEPGTEWPAAKREQWLETARNIFGLMYADPADASAPPRAQPVDFTAYAESRLGQQHSA